jgi:hypothetical protein
MSRTLGLSGFVRVLRAGSVAAVSAALVLSCSDNSTGPADGVGHVRADGRLELVYSYPDSIRFGSPDATASFQQAPDKVVANVLSSGLPAAFASSVPSTSTYNVVSVPFAPEAAPTANLGPTNDFSVLPNAPIGFTFNFFGNSYTTINISSSGLVQFGNPQTKDGCCWGWFIAKNDQINNVIAVGWSAWTASAVSKPIRYETRGTAPNRRFVLQYNNIPEDGGGGRLTAQLILYEHSNDIVLYSSTLSTTIKRHSITQGIENNTGTESNYIAGRDSALFAIANDGVKFALNAVNTPPIVTAPANLSVNTDAGVCVAHVDVGVPTITDDAPGSTYAGVRSDNQALDALYPKGNTSINWTATDVEGLKSSATQSVLVSDKQNPSIVAAENYSVRVNRGVSFATVTVAPPAVSDNCDGVAVSSSRSDNAPLSAGYPIGVTTITWTAKDAAGNTANASQTVTVVGNASPVVSAPANLSVNTDARACSALVDPGMATATDDTDGTTVAGTRTDGLPLNSAYPKGVTTIKWVATDADGLTASANQTVTVSDKEKPEVHAPANVSVGNDPHLASAAVSVGAATASDNCPSVNVSGSRNDGLSLGAAYPVGVTMVTWTAVDASGNSNSASQSITVSDIEAPSLVVPHDLHVNATMPSGAVVTYSVTAADNVGVSSVSCEPRSGSVFAIGYSEINCVARDAAGNSVSREFGVEVVSADDQISDLIIYIQSLRLSNGVEMPLVNQLRNSLKHDSMDQQCTKLNDFMNLVSVKANAIPAASVSYMNDAAGRIERVIGCASAPAAPLSARVLSISKNRVTASRTPVSR